MTKSWISSLALLFTALLLKAQPIAEREAINKLCGCFEVSFKYAETFAPDPAYQYYDREEIGGTAELALPIEVTDKKIVIQHLLIVGPSTVVKHWREEWMYENPVIWKYTGDRVWIKDSLPLESVKGKWTQSVWEVADEPRYQGFGQFINIEGKAVWQNTTDAPLPRREYTIRNDYNILRRMNRLHITDSGYLHEQDNQKIIRKQGALDKLVVEEKGWNTYRRINQKECAAAKAYWEKNQAYWGKVRQIWASYLATHNNVALKDTINNKMLHEYLISQSKDYAAQKISPDAIESVIKQTIQQFIQDGTVTTMSR
jgi:hypothetical protein